LASILNQDQAAGRRLGNSDRLAPRLQARRDRLGKRYQIVQGAPLLGLAASLFALGSEFLTLLTVQAFGIGLVGTRF
jgi:hypothetical protein